MSFNAINNKTMMTMDCTFNDEKFANVAMEEAVLRKLFHMFKPEMYENNNSRSRSPKRKRRTKSRRSDSSSSVFNLYDERSCFLSKKRKLVCGT